MENAFKNFECLECGESIAHYGVCKWCKLENSLKREPSRDERRIQAEETEQDRRSWK